MKYHSMPVVRVEIRHEIVESCDFLQWSLREKVFPIRGCGCGSPTGMVQFFEPDDAAKVEAWLKEQGAEKMSDEEITC